MVVAQTFQEEGIYLRSSLNHLACRLRHPACVPPLVIALRRLQVLSSALDLLVNETTDGR